MSIDESREVTIAEAAELTGLSKRAIARRIERGRLRAGRRENGWRYVRVGDLAEAGLVDLGAGAPPLWRTEQVDARVVAEELIEKLVRQGIELNDLRRQFEALQEESRRQDEGLREQIEQARLERIELRSQIEELRRQAG